MKKYLKFSLMLLLTALISSAPLTAHALEELSYYTLDEYFTAFPQQKEIYEIFSAKVSADAQRINQRQKDSVKIALVYPAIQQSNYWRDSVTSMSKRLDELGIRHETAKYYSKPSGDYRLQAMQIAEASKSDADYIIISVDNTNVRRLVPSLVAKDKPKVMIQNLTTPLKIWGNSQPFMYIGFDHIEGSKILADKYSEIFPRGGKYVMLYGTKGTVSNQRGGGFESYALSKGFVPVAKFYTDFDADKAYDAVINSLMKHDDISFIFACSTDIAIGASKAVAEAGLTGKVLVNGWGGTLNELNLILTGMLDFTVMRMNDDNGVAIAEAIKLDITGQREKVPLVYSGDFVTADKNMNDEDIKKLIKRALRYSGK